MTGIKELRNSLTWLKWHFLAIEVYKTKRLVLKMYQLSCGFTTLCITLQWATIFYFTLISILSLTLASFGVSRNGSIPNTSFGHRSASSSLFTPTAAGRLSCVHWLCGRLEAVTADIIKLMYGEWIWAMMSYTVRNFSFIFVVDSENGTALKTN